MPDRHNVATMAAMVSSVFRRAPAQQGLVRPAHEHDACGVGFVVDIKGKRSHDIVAQGAAGPLNLEHRGACGCEANTGDGAGILIQMPDALPARRCVPFALPAAGAYGAGLVFLPHDERDRDAVKALFEQIVAEEGQRAARLARRADRQRRWSATAPGPTSRSFEQVFIGARARRTRDRTRARFERKLYVIRKRVENAVDALKINALSRRFVLHRQPVVATRSSTRACSRRSSSSRCSRTCATSDCESALALVHQRFSTNTFPTWPLAHPYRYDRAQRRDQHAARQHQLDARARGAAPERRCSATTCKKILPIIREGGSDSAMLRQRARAAGDGRPLAAARDDDDDPRAVERPRER